MSGQQTYRDQFAGMTAKQRHDLMMNDYMRYYGGSQAVTAAGGWEKKAKAHAASQVIQSDMSALREGHRFIRTAEDDATGGLAAKLARRYYDRLFKEYAIADLSRYKESKLGLRWRTQQEVVSGKGQFICGAKGCQETSGLASFEVNFAYQEAGQSKQALVKLRLCSDCAYKLNYKKEKQYRKVQAKQLREAVQQGKKRGRDNDDETERKRRVGYEEGEDKEWVVPSSELPGQARSQAATTDDKDQAQEQPSVLSADPSVWEQKAPVQEATIEQELDDYLEAMFM